MAVAVDSVSPQTTLAIIIGASEFPKCRLEPKRAFANSARDLKKYLLDEEGFGLPNDNLIDHFDDPGSPAEILDQLANFLIRRQREMKETGAARDLLLFYTGHGGFTSDREYFLAGKFTRLGMEGAT